MVYYFLMNLSNKIITKQKLQKKLHAYKKSGKTIAFTNGCFDLMHMGHVSYLEKAKGAPKQNRILIVGLNSDKSISSIKGPSRPICPQQSRAAVLAALACVDFVVIFNEDTPYNLIKALQPDILIKGADWKGKQVIGSDIAKKLEFITYINGFSTTNIIEELLHTK